MKLILNLAHGTHTFEVTGKVSVKYTSEGMEIIEDINDNVVDTTEAVPVVQKNANIPRLSVIDIINMIDHMSIDNDIVHVRELLKRYLSDTKFNDIIVALKTYANKTHITTSNTTTWSKRIRSLMCTSMFILSGFTFHKAQILLNGHPISKDMTRILYSNMKTGSYSPGYTLIAELLWPERIRVYEKKKLARAKSDDKCRDKIQKYKQIVNVLKYGYSHISVARFFDISPDVVYRIKHNYHRLSKCVKYDGIYPIGSDVILPHGANAIDVHVCKKCSCIIPVKDVVYANCTELCINCQNKKEKTQIS